MFFQDSSGITPAYVHLCRELTCDSFLTYNPLCIFLVQSSLRSTLFYVRRGKVTLPPPTFAPEVLELKCTLKFVVFLWSKMHSRLLNLVLFLNLVIVF